MRIIAGEARGRTIDAPKGLHTRPTLDRIRENLFNMLQGDIPGSRILDLFSGSGALSFESLSRGADFSVLVDSDRNAHQTERNNAEKLGYSKRCRILNMDWQAAVRLLVRENALFDIVFLDPPYRMLDLCDLFELLVPVIRPESLIVLEHEAGKEAAVSERFEMTRERSWGFCAVSFYQLKQEGE